jgi:hypothetical protein
LRHLDDINDVSWAMLLPVRRPTFRFHSLTIRRYSTIIHHRPSGREIPTPSYPCTSRSSSAREVIEWVKPIFMSWWETGLNQAEVEPHERVGAGIEWNKMTNRRRNRMSNQQAVSSRTIQIEPVINSRTARIRARNWFEKLADGRGNQNGDSSKNCTTEHIA